MFMKERECECAFLCCVLQDSESDDSLDDEAMMAVDEALAAAFRSRLSTRKKQKKGEIL